MLDIKDLILQLSEQDYIAFNEMLEESKAEKSQRLLHFIRQDNMDDKDIIDSLEVNSTAFYTLRSRLNDKLQDYLLEKVQGPRLEILEKVNNLDHILFHYPQKQATSIVEKLQAELTRFDQPIYLLTIYSALKKLHRNSPNEYQFSQFFNQHITFVIDYDKNEDLLSELLQTIGMHTLSRDPMLFMKLHIIMQQIEEHNAGYATSPRFFITRAIAAAHYQIYLSEEDQQVDLDSVEDLFARAYEIINKNQQDIFFGNLKLLFDYLSFEYYAKYGIRKKIQEYREVLEDEYIRFLNSYSYYAIPSMLLLRMLKVAQPEETAEAILVRNAALQQQYDISKDDPINFINFYMYLAASHHKIGEYEQSNQHLMTLRNELSFKPYPHAEISLKLLLATNYLMMKEEELANSLIKSVGRKLGSLDYYDYPNVKLYRRILQQALKHPTKDRKLKMIGMVHEFKLLNDNTYSILDMLQLDDVFVNRLLGQAN